MGKPDIKRYIVTVHYAGNKTIRNLLKKGKYDRVSKNLTDKNFPTEETGTKKEEIYLIHFNKIFDNGARIIKELDKPSYKYKPANPPPFLALGAEYPDLQRQFPLAALGQHWVDPSGDHYIVCLRMDLGGRDAGLGFLGVGWDADWYFAAVPK